MKGDEDTIRAIYAAFGQGDVAGILERLDPDVEWEHDWGTLPPAIYAPRRGRAAVSGFFEALRDFEFERFEPVAFLSGADAAGTRMMAVPIHVAILHRSTGAALRDLEVHLWTFGANGLVTRLRHVIDLRPFAHLH